MYQSILLVVLFCSCTENVNQKASGSNTKVPEKNDSSLPNKIIITDLDYMLELNGVRDTFATLPQLSTALQAARNDFEEDTLYIFMNSTISDRLVDVSPMLRSIDLDKYKFIIGNNYFDLPYQ